MTDRPILSPSQLNALARSLLEDSFPSVQVEGELCNLSRPASGHLYFSLKDRDAQVRCALFRPKSQWLRFKPADGQRVLARGRVTLYEPRGDYQLILDTIEPAGEGALQRALDELKQRLAAEGLFAAERKRPIPAWIGRLGVISSPRGAAIHDVLSVLGKRFPLLSVELLPVPVQGEGAAQQIRAMLERADRSGRYDALLLTRGGGSLEDLQAFNDEALARAIVACRTPVACAIGHEIDSCIAEFVADLRAPTPSAAAAALVPDRAELAPRLQVLQQRLAHVGLRRRQTLAQRIDQLFMRLSAQRPQARLARDRLRLAELQARWRHAVERRALQRRERLAQLAERLQRVHPRRRQRELHDRLLTARRRLQSSMALQLTRDGRAAAALARALHAVSPLATLSRGYTILRDENDTVLRSIEQLSIGQTIIAQLADGRASAVVVHREAGNGEDRSVRGD